VSLHYTLNSSAKRPGVIQIVQGLLVGLSGLLASLGGGLLAGMSFRLLPRPLTDA
jgi:F0F1-type ATP synthase membrane subunit c/vacuolar-type H+-ATPase subunit K